jgi:hypothetical protein
MHRYRVVFLCCALAACAGLPVKGDQQTRKLTPPEERELAYMALSAKAKKLPGLDLESQSNASFPDFAFFHVTWGSGADGGKVDDLAVDATTGDVWNGLVCREEKSPELHKLQEKMRRRIGLSASRYATLKKQGPMCDMAAPAS